LFLVLAKAGFTTLSIILIRIVRSPPKHGCCIMPICLWSCSRSI